MITNKTDIIRAVSGLLSDVLDKKRFGEYGIYITMNDGAPAKITEINQFNIIRRTGGRVEITK
ncbi:MAG: hypothetical protein M0P01_08535 [Treponema sp.]|nr:hypothetical protein [Treponema sp.]